MTQDSNITYHIYLRAMSVWNAHSRWTCEIGFRTDHGDSDLIFDGIDLPVFEREYFGSERYYRKKLNLLNGELIFSYSSNYGTDVHYLPVPR